MRVILTGGGTGGHITPLLAVAHKLKQLDPSVEVIYVGERGSRFDSMTEDQTVFDSQYKVFAGKFRRYHGESWLRRLFDFKTNLLNLRDFFYFLFGTIESWFLLHRLKPDVILLKGGFVGVPIGLAARKRFPIVTHDSDALPGLANRLVGRWAIYHATGMPSEYYQYPEDKVKYVGVIVSDDYKEVDADTKLAYRTQLKLPAEALVLMVTGGSNGAQSLNQAFVQLSPTLLKDHPSLHIIHQVGSRNENVYRNYKDPRLTVSGLLKDMYVYSGAADVIVTRAGANTLAEFGVQSKACVVIPNPMLTGGHQTKNADFLTQNQAAVVVNDETLNANIEILKDAIEELLVDANKRDDLGRKLRKLTVPDAAVNLAKLLIEVGGVGK
ncbi:MAG: glycosyltransferase [Candidatus Saccharibacteria bacterium]